MESWHSLLSRDVLKNLLFVSLGNTIYLPPPIGLYLCMRGTQISGYQFSIAQEILEFKAFSNKHKMYVILNPVKHNEYMFCHIITFACIYLFMCVCVCV